MNNKKYFQYLIYIIVLILVVIIAKEKLQFPVNYVLCGSGYTDCKTYAKFDDMDSCQWYSERNNWLCHSTDPTNITCKVSNDSFVVSYCKD